MCAVHTRWTTVVLDIDRQTLRTGLRTFRHRTHVILHVGNSRLHPGSAVTRLSTTGNQRSSYTVQSWRNWYPASSTVTGHQGVATSEAGAMISRNLNVCTKGRFVTSLLHLHLFFTLPWTLMTFVSLITQREPLWGVCEFYLHDRWVSNLNTIPVWLN